MNGIAPSYRIIVGITVHSGRKVESSTSLYLDSRMRNISSGKSQYFQSSLTSLKLHNRREESIVSVFVLV